MTFSFKYGATIYEKPIRDVLQRWRRSLASLLFFIILLTENFGLSSCLMNRSSHSHSTDQILQDIFGIKSSNLPLPFMSSRSQCLYIDRNTSRTMCSLKAEQRKSQIRDTRLKFCNFYTVSSLINGKKVREKCLDGTAQECEQCFEELEHIDAGLYALMCSYEETLSRYDCRQISHSSTRFNCTDCLIAYKNWLCATNLRYYGDEGVRLKPIPPCRQYCTAVLARCPYFLPAPEEQYSGEPAFLCRSDHDHTEGTSSGCYSPDHIPGAHSRHTLPDYPVSAPSTGSLTRWPSPGLILSLLISWTLFYLHILDFT